VSDYDVLPFSDGNGALYLGNVRSASYQWLEAGYTMIHLYEVQPGGTEICHEGYHAQSEKVPEVCEAWVSEGEFSPNFWRWDDPRRVHPIREAKP
jgi:hypothetical protein